MKLFTAFCLALLPLTLFAAELKIAEGERYLVQPSQSILMLDKLEIGDGAQIRFAPGVASWRLQAKRALIGNDVVIDGTGAAGRAGAAGAAGSCASQMDGQAGTHGAPGGNGVSMHLQLGIEALGGLRIVAQGGRGGAGGHGGEGADNSDDCAGDQGGAGGDGGVGGAGGSGGSIVVLYHTLAPQLEPITLARRLKVSVEGGPGGEGGRGGAGGQGSDGRYVNKKSLTGNRQWVAGGKEGLSGSQGLAGERGASGAVMIDPIMAPTSPAATVAPDRLQQLEQRLQALEKRLRVLETKQN